MPALADIDFTEAQADLLEAATRFCRERAPMERVRALIEDEAGFDRDVWREMAELGWVGAAIPEAYGGSGLGLGALVPVVEQMGRRLMAGPFVSTVVAAEVVLAAGSEAQRRALLSGLCAGKIAALALSEDAPCRAEPSGAGYALFGRKLLVQDAAAADWLAVSVARDGAPAVAVVEAARLPKTALRRERVVDETKRSFELTLDGVMVEEAAFLDPAKTARALERAHLAANLILSAEMCGGTAGVIDLTVEYLNTRKQFGRQIGAYQALKHPTVDAHIAYELARSHLYAAAAAFERQGEAEIAARMAKAQACVAFEGAAHNAIQFHGGFGFTYDCDAQLYRRRAMFDAALHGDAVYHRKRLADLLFGPAGE